MKSPALSFVSALTLLLAAGAANATEWHRPLVAGAWYGATARAAAQAYLSQSADELDLRGVDLRVRSVLPLGDFRTVRLEQRYHGLEVIGTGVAVRVSPAGAVRRAVIDVARDLSVAPAPSLSANEARAAVSELLGTGADGHDYGAKLAILPVEGSAGKLVWKIDVPTADGGERYLIDAHAGVLLHQRSLALDALGRVYPISSVATPATQDLELTDMDVATPQHLNGWGGLLTVTNYVSGDTMSGYTVDQTVEPNAGADFLYDPPADPTDATDAFAQVGIYYHLTRMRNFYTTDLGLDMSAPSWKLTAVANVLEGGNPVDNAFFSEQGVTGPYASPNLIAIGQGTTFDFAQDSDVFLHEFTHFVSGNAIGYNGGQGYANSYGLSPFGGAIDEGVSDYFACTENDDPLLGEASLALLGSARDLTVTSKSCPDDMLGEVHEDGEIIASLSWTLHEAFGKAAGDQLVWGAMTLLTPDTTFGDYGRALKQTAADLVTQNMLTNGDLQTLDTAIAERGLDECDAELPLRKDEPRKATLIGLDVVAQFFGGTCEQVKNFGVSLQSLFHFVVTPDASDEGVRFHVDLSLLGNGTLSWAIYARQDQHVSFTPNGMLADVSEYDYAVENLTDTTGELVIDASSSPPFDPNATYHMVVVDQNCPLTTAVITTSNVTPATGGGGAGGGGVGGAGGAGGGPAAHAVEVDDGCGCRLGDRDPNRSAWAWLMVAALGLGASRRRRS